MISGILHYKISATCKGHLKVKNTQLKINRVQINTGWPSSVPKHPRGTEREETEEEVKMAGTWLRVSWLWSLLPQQNDEQHGPISIFLLPVCLQPTGASTICHCRWADAPNVSPHLSNAQLFRSFCFYSHISLSSTK